jgi:RNA polymerase sigma factor (sigma-70 family)
MSEQDRQIAETIEREQGRLRNFIRKRVPDRRDVEDVLQDVFFELVEAQRLMKPIEEVGAWLFRVARNRIIDRFRKKRPESSTLTTPTRDTEEGDIGSLEDLLPSATLALTLGAGLPAVSQQSVSQPSPKEKASAPARAEVLVLGTYHMANPGHDIHNM